MHPTYYVFIHIHARTRSHCMLNLMHMSDVNPSIKFNFLFVIYCYQNTCTLVQSHTGKWVLMRVPVVILWVTHNKYLLLRPLIPFKCGPYGNKAPKSYLYIFPYSYMRSNSTFFKSKYSVQNHVLSYMVKTSHWHCKKFPFHCHLNKFYNLCVFLMLEYYYKKSIIL